MKKILIIIVIILLVVAGIYYFYIFKKEQPLSSDQQEIIDTFGSPKRFTISYMPQGEGETEALVRTETWSYPDHLKEITFVAGKIFSVDNIDEETGNITYSDLKSEDFDFSMNYDDVASALGNNEIKPVDFAPELYVQGETETYVADHVIFSIEYGHLVYLQTVGIEDK